MTHSYHRTTWKTEVEGFQIPGSIEVLFRTPDYIHTAQRAVKSFLIADCVMVPGRWSAQGRAKVLPLAHALAIRLLTCVLLL